MEFGLLGGLSIQDNGTALPIGGPKQQVLLGALLANRNSPVPLERLVDFVWHGEQTPARADRTLASYISRLRSIVGKERLISAKGTLRLKVENSELDSARYEQLVATLRTELDRGNLDSARQALARSLLEWQEQPFGLYTSRSWAIQIVQGLEALRLEQKALEAQLLLDEGRPRAALTALDPLIASEPLSETLRTLQLVAIRHLHGPAAATRALDSYRSLLVDTTGLDPSDELEAIGVVLRTGAPLTTAVARPPLRGYQRVKLLTSLPSADQWLATANHLGTTVVLTIVNKSVANRPEFVDTFEQRARQLAQFSHQANVELIDHWREPEAAYLVHPYVVGTPLNEWVVRGQHPDLVLDAIRQLGDLLDCAHRSSLTHGSLDANAVIIRADGRLSTTGLGLGALLSAGSPPNVGRGPQVEDQRAFRQLVLQLFTAASDAGFDLDDRILELLEADEPPATSTAQTIRRIEAYLGAAQSTQPSEFTTACPFVGLAAFQETDASVFFGRGQVINTIVQNITSGHPFIAIVGPSGSGKSSVVRAGVVPVLRQKAASSSVTWFVATMTPGDNPLQSLDTALETIVRDARNQDRLKQDALNRPNTSDGNDSSASAISSSESKTDALLNRLRQIDGRVLLVVDQLEELFSDSARESAEQFVELLADALKQGTGSLQVVTTLRSDFFDQALRLPQLEALLQPSVQPLGAMSASELERTITRPIALSGWRIEPGLVARFIRDVGDNPTSLPLLQFSLTSLWADVASSDPSTPMMTLEWYDKSGGIAASVARKAEQTFSRLSIQEQLHVERSMRRLTNVDDQTAPTRRRLHVADLPEGALAALNPFVDARLLSSHFDPTTNAPTIEIAHEALLASWPRLSVWIETHAETIRLERLVTERASDWASGGRQIDDLLRGAKLDEIQPLTEAGSINLTSSEHEFVQASIHEHARKQIASERRAIEAETRNQRLRHLLTTSALLLFLAMLASVLAITARSGERSQRQTAEAANLLSEARRMSAEAVQLTGSNPEVALLLATEAYRNVPNAQTLGALQDVIVGLGPFLGLLGAEREYRQAEWLDERTIVGLHSNGVDIFSLNSPQPTVSRQIAAGVALAVDPERQVLAVAVNPSGVRVYDRNLQLISELASASSIQALAFSPAGHLLVAGDRSGTISLWNVEDGTQAPLTVKAMPEAGFDELPTELRPSESAAHEPLSYPIGISALVFSPDGQHIAAAGGVFVRVFDLNLDLSFDLPIKRPTVTGESRGPGRPTILRWRDRHQLTAVVESYLQTIDVFTETVTNEILVSTQVTSAGHIGFGYDISDSVEIIGLPTGVLLVRDSINGEREFNVGDALRQAGQPVAIAPNNRTFAVAGDGIRLFAIDGRRVIADAVQLDDPYELYISSDGMIATSFDQATARSRLWRRDDGMHVADTVDSAQRFVTDVFGPLAMTVDNRVILLDPASGEPTGVEVVGFSAWAGAIDPTDGSWLAVGFGQPGPPVLRILDPDTGTTIATIDDFVDLDAKIIISLAVSPDGQQLAAATASGHAIVYETTGWTSRAVISQGGGQVTALAFTPDGKQLFTSGDDGVITIRDASTFQPTGRQLLGAPTTLRNFQPWGFTSDGDYVVSVLDSRLRIHDLESGDLVGQPLPGDLEVGANVSPDGRFATSTVGDVGLIWKLNPSNWPAVACNIVGRNLTDSEWAQWGPPGELTPATCTTFEEPNHD